MKHSVLLLVLAFPCPARAEMGDAARGQTVYERCEGCHSPDANRVGPMHRGVVGRKAGSLPDYSYSQGLRSAGFVWTDELLDKWLTNPQALVPGAKMGFRLGDPQERADVIAYLEPSNDQPPTGLSPKSLVISDLLSAVSQSRSP